jgi:site-specific recombinase XerD
MSDMNHADTPSLSHFVQCFFGDYLTNQRRLSSNTLLSYRDAFKLLLVFAAAHHRKEVTQLDFTDVDADTVLAFLTDLERSRGCSVRTRNAQLAAMHTFFRYVAAREPRVLFLCQQIALIPVKKAGKPLPTYLEYSEVVHILGTIGSSTPLGRRDRLLVHLLFETGARAQELASLRASSFRLSPPYQVRILGKGHKERICPVRAGTAELVRGYLRERGLAEGQDAPLLVSVTGHPLTRHGILRVVQRRVRAAATTLPSLASKRVGAHTFRHTAAIHLLRAGNALPVIRSWLGHVSVVTTDHYTRIDLEMKRQALEATEPLAHPGPPSWPPDPDLIQWLEAL